MKQIENKALKYAIKAHKDQVRKSEPDKPMIFHPINVGQILKEYGFDENVVAAGFLHDVVEDTDCTIEDIEKEFGDDITSLVYGASEPDKSLPWEERKKHTIESIKDMDIRHKALICADKISNLEDLNILFGKTAKYDFSAFKRGFKEQQWYYTGVYEALIQDEDEIHPIFNKYKDLLERVFYNGNVDVYLRNIIFDDDPELYKKLQVLDYKKKELLKLKRLSDKTGPYVIEFTGTPRTGKTTLINNLEDFFKKGGLSVDVLEEFTTSKKYKEKIYPTLKNNYKNVINTEIPKYVLEQLKESIEKNKDIIIVDRSLLDRLIWANRLWCKGGFTKQEYHHYKDTYIPLIKEYIDIIIGTYANSTTSVKRDYKNSLALEERHFLNIDNVEEYNYSLGNVETLCKENKINFHRIDTEDRTEQDVSLETANIILDNAREEFIRRLKNTYK